MKKIIFSFFLLAPLAIFAQIQDVKSTILYEGTEVSVKCLNELKGSELKVGDNINFELAKPVIVNDQVALNAGLHVIGTVTSAAGSKAFGKKGKLEFTIDYLYLKDGRPIKLRNTVAAAAKSRGVETAVVSVVLSPLGLFIHGAQAKFEAGTTFKAFVDHDIKLN
jgi:hypothetical protein